MSSCLRYLPCNQALFPTGMPSDDARFQSSSVKRYLCRWLLRLILAVTSYWLPMLLIGGACNSLYGLTSSEPKIDGNFRLTLTLGKGRYSALRCGSGKTHRMRFQTSLVLDAIAEDDCDRMDAP